MSLIDSPKKAYELGLAQAYECSALLLEKELRYFSGHAMPTDMLRIVVQRIRERAKAGCDVPP